jgi:tetratricopeptide (TPR) repeat protein
MKLDPGDLLQGLAVDQFVELECPAESNNVYRIASPFRIMINVASAPPCDLNMMAGGLDVMAEEPTRVTTGGVGLRSVGTQYAVRLGQSDGDFGVELLVYDGVVRVAADTLYQIVAGRRYFVGARLAPMSIREQDVRQSANVYATFDVARAKSAGLRFEDELTATEELANMHFQVLSYPDNAAARVNLAEAQVNYGLTNQALFNLKRGGVTDEATLREYDIDPNGLERGLNRINRQYFRVHFLPEIEGPQPEAVFDAPIDPAEVRAAPAAGEAAAARRTARGGDATREALAFLEEGRYEEAIKVLESLADDGTAASVDYYVLAIASLKLGQTDGAVRFAKEALKMAERDQGLSDAQSEALKEIVVRIGR